VSKKWIPNACYARHNECAQILISPDFLHSKAFEDLEFKKSRLNSQHIMKTSLSDKTKLDQYVGQVKNTSKHCFWKSSSSVEDEELSYTGETGLRV
jgi:hypothetical protein